MRLALVLLYAFSAAAATAGAQYATVTGQVLSGDTGRPVAKATVELQPDRASGGPAVVVTTDGGGRFAIERVEPGTYRLAARRNGYVRGEYGAKRAGGPGRSVALAAGQREEVTLRLVRAGVITGTIVDVDGEPLAGVEVALLQLRGQDGERLVVQTAAERTDDRGRFRIHSLQPGAYYMRASHNDAGAPVYYPGAADLPRAETVNVAAGAEVVADIVYVPAPTFRVRGRVVDALSGAVPKKAHVMLARRDGIAEVTVGASVSEADGSFEIRGVRPGSYLLAGAAGGASVQSGRMDVEVGGADLEGIVLQLHAPRQLRGRITIEGATSLPKDLQLSLVPERRGMTPARTIRARLDPDGSFTLSDVMRDRYFVTVSGAGDDAYIASASFGSRDALKEGVDTLTHDASRLDVVIGTGAARIDGRVKDAGEGTFLVLTPDDDTRAFRETPRTFITDETGTYRFTGLRPGKYRLAAFADERLAEEPAAGEPVEIELRERDRVTRDLEVIARD